MRYREILTNGIVRILAAILLIDVLLWSLLSMFGMLSIPGQIAYWFYMPAMAVDDFLPLGTDSWGVPTIQFLLLSALYIATIELPKRLKRRL